MSAAPHPVAVLHAHEIVQTVNSIAAQQLPDGNIPWFEGAHTDPWNLVEAAMALDVGGRHDAARRAFAWLQDRQRADGAWHWYYLDDAVEHEALDTNVTAYVATGVWHHYLATRDARRLRRYWPMVRAAIGFALSHQQPCGEIAWRGDDPSDGALLTACSSIHLSLRCALAIAGRLGYEVPDWELALGKLASAVARGGDLFLDKSRWSMDWYYPVLGGVLGGDTARARLAEQWARFVVDGRGVRCVADRPWITVGETCELVLTLVAIGAPAPARRLFEAIQFLRTPDGSYWTGANFAREQFDNAGELYPLERTTWSAAAVVLAAHALEGRRATSGLFRGVDLPRGLTDDVIRAEAPAGSRTSPPE